MQGNNFTKISHWCFVLTVITALIGCNSPEMTPEHLTAWVADEENHLTLSQQYRGYDIRVTYKPQDLLIAQELDAAASMSDLATLEEKYKDHLYFILALSKGGKEAADASSASEEFSELIRILSFRMADYVNITTSGGDTVHVADYVFPRTYGMSEATTLMFAFPKDKTADDQWLQLNLKEFGPGLGIRTFRFELNDINSVPKIAAIEQLKADTGPATQTSLNINNIKPNQHVQK